MRVLLFDTICMYMKKHIHYHKDGSIWATGAMKNNKMHGYWEWFRKDGTKMRSGNFDKGIQVGEWITYDKEGQCHKITSFSAKQNIFEALSKPAQRALANAGITSLSKLSKWNEADLLKLHGIGPASLPLLRALLKSEGKQLKKKV